MGNWIRFLVCCLIWSSTWLFIKTGLESFAPLTGLALRFLISAPILLGIAFVRREPMPRGIRQWGLLGFLGITMFALPFGLIYWGEGSLPSGLTAVLFATQAVWAAVFAHRMLSRERLSLRRLSGILLALLGVVLVCLEKMSGPTTWLATAAVLAGALVQGFNPPFLRKHMEKRSSLWILSWSSLFGSLALIPVALLFEHGHMVRAVTPLGLLSLLYLALIGSVLVLIVFFDLLRDWGAIRSSTVSLVTPGLAVLWGWMFLQEPVGSYFLAGAALVLGGVWLAHHE